MKGLHEKNGGNFVKKLLVVFLTLFFVLQMGIAQEEKKDENARNPEAGQAFNKGLNLARKGNFAEAAPEFQNAIDAAETGFPDAHYMLAYCYKKLEDYPKSEEQFKKAIEVDKNFDKAYLALGNLQSQMGKNDEATHTFNAALQVNPQSPKAYFGLGKIYHDMGNHSKAIENLTKAVELADNYVLAYNVLGLSYKELGQFSNAAEAFRNAIENEDRRIKKGTFYYRLGTTYLKLKKYNQAVDALSNAISMSRNSLIVAGSNFYMGEAFKNTNQKQKALKYYERATKHSAWKQAAEYEIDLIKNPDKYAY
ncbi:MAG: tetratricopeptide repeat protein [Caldithrix sp.]|nr:tetratricopeptide repeat protein [Caldithrix sp.]